MDDVIKPRTGPPDTRRGIAFDEAASALQGAIRRGDEETAVRFAVELELSGFEAYVWRRLAVVVSEDVGLAEPHLPATFHALRETAEWLKETASPKQKPWRLMLIHAVLLIARAKKSRIADSCLIWASREQEPLEVPDYCFDKHTKRGRKMGRGEEHFWKEKALLADRQTGELTYEPHLPDAYRTRAMRLRGGVEA